MKRWKFTQKAALWGIAIGTAAAAAIWFWIIDDGVWWGYLIFGCMVAVGVYQGLIEQKGKENLANMK